MYLKKFRLDGKTAIVTGACGILGRHFCRGLAEAGANIAALDIDEAALREVETEIADYGVRSLSFVCDVAQSDDVKRVVASIISHFGVVNVLLNNAATKSRSLDKFFESVEKYDPIAWRDVMAVNLDGMFWMAREVGEHMVRIGGGSIVQTASIYGIVAPDQSIYEGSRYLDREISSPAVYSASKAGVVGLTKYLACYWAKTGVRVNNLIPGGVGSGQNSEFERRYSARVPMARMAEAHEMVGAALFLASDAASYVTGQSIVVDGGLTAW